MSGVDSEAQKALLTAQAKIRLDYTENNVGPDSDMLADRICKSFQAAYDNPPMEEFQQILQKNMTLDEVRVCIFAPREAQVRYYPVLLLAGSQLEVRKLGDTHPLVRLKALILSTLFLLHRFSWKGFLEEFVVRGGLSTLACMLDEPNLYFRGQIVELFLTITDCDNWDWFAPRSDVIGRTLHIRFLELSETPAFLDNLVANRQHSFPGGSMRCLQLLAFWLSWVRAMYTKVQQLVLSPQLLMELEVWAEQGPTVDSSIDIDVSGSDSVIETDDSGAPSDEAVVEEKKLAATLFSDFSRDQFQARAETEELDNATAATDIATPGGSASSATAATELASSARTGAGAGASVPSLLSVTGINPPDVDAEVKAKVTAAFARIDDSIQFRGAETEDNALAAPVLVNTKEELVEAEMQRVAAAMAAEEALLRSLSAYELKERGNGAFGRGDYLEAQSLYEYGLASVAAGRVASKSAAKTGTAGELSESEVAKVRCTLHFNSAACHWKVYQKKREAAEAALDLSLNGESASASASASSTKSGGYQGSSTSNKYMDHSLLQRTRDITEDQVLHCCADHCRRAAAADSTHFKAGYRLGAVLLALGQAEEALLATEAGLAAVMAAPTRGGDTSTETSYSQLRELRTRCMAAKLLREQGKKGKDSKISKRAASVLAALQRRKLRENNRETHALSSSYEPLGEKQGKDEQEKEMGKAAARSKKQSTKDADNADVDVSAYFGANNIYTSGAGSSKAARAASKGAGAKKDRISKSAASSVADADDSSIAAKVKEVQKAKRAAEKKATKKKLQEVLLCLKKIATGGSGSSSSIADAECCSSKQQSLIVSSLESIWATVSGSGNKSTTYTLAAAFADTSAQLDEPLIVLLLTLSDQLFLKGDVASAAQGLRCVTELRSVDRFSSLLSMALFGNTSLQAVCSSLQAVMVSHGDAGALAAAALKA